MSFALGVLKFRRTTVCIRHVAPRLHYRPDTKSPKIAILLHGGLRPESNTRATFDSSDTRAGHASPTVPDGAALEPPAATVGTASTQNRARVCAPRGIILDRHAMRACVSSCRCVCCSVRYNLRASRHKPRDGCVSNFTASAGRVDRCRAARARG